MKTHLGDFVTIIGGGTPDRSTPEFWDGDIPWATVKDINEKKYLTSTQESVSSMGIAKSATNIVQPGTVITATRIGLGKVTISTAEVAINQDLKALYCKPSLLPHYLYYFLLKSTPAIQAMGKGATVKGITLDDLKGLPMQLPPIDVQQRIADTLDKADSLRRKDHELLKKYDELAKSIFYEMFGDPKHNSKGWELQPLGTLINSIKSGTSLGGEDRELLPGEFGVLKVSAVTTGIFKADEYKVPAQADIVKEKVTVSEGDLLFSRANTRELVGAVAIAEHTYSNLMLPDKLWRLDFNPDLMRKHYCKAILSDPSIRYNLTKTATGTSGSMLNISMGKLRDLEVPVPPVELQMQFEEVAKKLLTQKRIAGNAAVQSEQLFTSLLESYLA